VEEEKMSRHRIRMLSLISSNSRKQVVYRALLG